MQDGGREVGVGKKGQRYKLNQHAGWSAIAIEGDKRRLDGKGGERGRLRLAALIKTSSDTGRV